MCGSVYVYGCNGGELIPDLDMPSFFFEREIEMEINAIHVFSFGFVNSVTYLQKNVRLKMICVMNSYVSGNCKVKLPPRVSIILGNSFCKRIKFNEFIFINFK